MNNMRNKILSLLVLLLTAATGARAQSNGTYSDLVEEIGFGGDKTLSHDYYKYDFVNHIVISTSGVIDGKGAIIDMEGASIPHVFYISADNVTIKNLSIINYTGTGDAIYFSGSGGIVINVCYNGALSPGTSANTWTLSMPASDVLLTPQYATVAKWAVKSAGTPEEKTLLPAAAEGVIAGTTAPLIVEGTVATTTIGVTTAAQGTVKYAVTETKTTAPALDDFSTTVPTAAKYDDAKTVYVWYYIEGIEPENFADRTAQNTFDNSDICTQPIEVSVLTNKFTLTLDPAPVEKVTVTIDNATDPATPDANGKIANIKMGSEVKIKANTGYKLRKVEVKKNVLPTLTSATTDDVGKLVATDGSLFATADEATAAGKTAAAMIAYVSITGHGLAIALSNEDSYPRYSNAGSTAAAHQPVVTGHAWSLPTKEDWQNMIIGCGYTGGASDNMQISGLKTKLSAVGSSLPDGFYWTGSMDDATYVWQFSPNGNNGSFASPVQSDSDSELTVRAVLAF